MALSKEQAEYMGKKGGKAKVKKGFACNPELARKAGSAGGRISRRGKAKERKEPEHANN